MCSHCKHPTHPKGDCSSKVIDAAGDYDWCPCQRGLEKNEETSEG